MWKRTFPGIDICLSHLTGVISRYGAGGKGYFIRIASP